MDSNSSFSKDKELQLRAMEEAMIHAVTDMEYEGLLQVMKRILSLRTHLDERVMSAEMPLQLVFKMAFAREQGIDVEEVYDPIAFGDLTDSQLATNNFLTDMQRSFRVQLTDEEAGNIKTVKDLVRTIISRRS